MNSLQSVYIALGSNQGHRSEHLQLAIDAIFEDIGDVVHLSKVYETPAWGFDGSAFYNLCIHVRTRMNASQVLKALLDIETKMGRERSTSGYQNRCIDLDILLYEKEIIDLPHLKVPHPAMAHRDFVLYPLADVAPDVVHPVLGKDIKSLKRDLESSGHISMTAVKLKTRRLRLPNINYLCIEGNIGVGKTTFAKMLAEDLEAKLILERYQENPFLPQFYKDPKRYAFPTEMAFLADRHQQLTDDISQLDLFSQFSVADYDLYKSLIFAKVNLQEQEFELYKKVFNIIYRGLPKPDLYIYFYQNTERLLDHIKRRGRDYEQDIKADYLEKINQGYLNFIKAENRFPTKIIDVTDLDFVMNRAHYLKLVEEIFSL